MTFSSDSFLVVCQDGVRRFRGEVAVSAFRISEGIWLRDLRWRRRTGRGSRTGAADALVVLVRAVEGFRVMAQRMLLDTPSRYASGVSIIETDGRRTSEGFRQANGHRLRDRFEDGAREQGVAHQSRPAPCWNCLGNVRCQIYDWFPRPLVEMGALQRSAKK